MSKAKRKGKIFIDHFRNGRGATAVAAYSTRAKTEAPVSTPLRWEELNEKLRSDHYNIHNLPERLAKLRRDPWEGYEKARRAITVEMKEKVRS
jgi:bifunctional non-homologous end joining protein LigD